MRMMTSLAAVCLATAPAMAQNAAEVARIAPILSAQKAEMDRLASYDGVYSGPWQIFKPDGSPAERGSTVHRVGPFLGGTIKIMEGRNYSSEGALVFNGMMVFSHNVKSKAWKMDVFAFGEAFEVKPIFTDTGYYFDAPGAEPDGFRRITITVTPTTWEEEVYDHHPAKPPVRLFSMKLKRVGATDWPLGRPNPDIPTPR